MNIFYLFLQLQIDLNNLLNTSPYRSSRATSNETNTDINNNSFLLNLLEGTFIATRYTIPVRIRYLANVFT